MKKAFLKNIVTCAACAMLATSAWAQAESQAQSSSGAPVNRSWSTKHLSATGRDGERVVRATQLNGAQVNDASGKPVATIEDTIINPASGRVDFALLSLTSTAEASNSTSSATTPQNSASANSGAPDRLVPVPWSLLKTASGSSHYSANAEKPTFTLNNVDQKKLNSAPSLSASDLSESEWQQRICSYYGVTPGSPAVGTAPMGGAESPAGELKGEGARRMENSNGQPPKTP